MDFDVIVGNPPYGAAKKDSSPTLHLKIMDNSIRFCSDRLVFIMPSKPIVCQLQEPWLTMFKNAVCTDIEVVANDVFRGTEMDKTAIYYCDRNDKPENYCKKLDVGDVIYNAIDDNNHRLFIDKMRFKQLDIHASINDSKSDELKIKAIEKLRYGKYYLNVSIANGTFGAKWFSGSIEKIDILSKNDEIGYLMSRKTRLNILECPNRQYGENLKNLMINGLVMRYGLWLTQTNQAIYKAQFKYVPDLDYTNIHSDEELLSACGFTADEITQVIDYLKGFDFSKNRNDLVRGSL